MTYISTGPCTPKKHKEDTQLCVKCRKKKVCINCEYIIDDVAVCETCADAIHEEVYQQEGICPNCGSECAPIMEDRHPDGIGYYETVGWKPCPECGYQNND